MDTKELALRVMEEFEKVPAVVQLASKTFVETLAIEVKEGRVVLTEMLETEEKFFDVVAEIVDLMTNTGAVDPIDIYAIRPLVEKILRPVLVKAFGLDWLQDIKKIINK